MYIYKLDTTLIESVPKSKIFVQKSYNYISISIILNEKTIMKNTVNILYKECPRFFPQNFTRIFYKTDKILRKTTEHPVHT